MPQSGPSLGRALRRRGKAVALNLTSMIDVVFLLLVFFIVTASFAANEGVLTARLPEVPDRPGQAAAMDDLPLRIVLSAQGMNGCRIDVESLREAPVSFTELSRLLERVQYDPARGRNGAYRPDTPIEIACDGRVRWQHVVNAFNAAVHARYSNVSFAQARSE